MTSSPALPPNASASSIPPVHTPEAELPTLAESPIIGLFAFAPGDGSLWIQDAHDGHAAPLVKAAPGIYANAPTFAPDGRQIAYSLNNLTAGGTVQTSLHIIDITGENERALAMPPDARTSFDWPAFAPDGRWVYYTALSSLTPGKQHTEIERVLAGGSGVPPNIGAEKIIDDGRLADVSGDNSKIAFIRFNVRTFTGALWMADAEGRNQRMLLADDVFAAINTPRFSPDGMSILFAASGPPRRQLPGALELRSPCEPLLLCGLAAPAQADGLPWDLWTVSSDGAHFQQLTRIGSDSPWPAWSRDGRSIAFYDLTGIYLLDRAQMTVARLNHNGGHGVFDWWMPVAP